MESFGAKEQSYRNEVKMLKQEVENMANIKNQEIQSLKFEMSSTEMKYETMVNVSTQLVNMQKKQCEGACWAI